MHFADVDSQEPAPRNSGSYADECLILFARYPKKGQCKRRLIADVGVDRAHEIYQALFDKTLKTTLEATRAHRNLIVAVEQASCMEAVRGLCELMRAEDKAPAPLIIPQRGEDLGRRMSNAMELAHQRGAKRVVLVGCDVPELSFEQIERSFDELRGRGEGTDHVVLGPSRDGGYYLVGTTVPLSSLFSGIEWGTDRVCQQTIARCEDLGVTFSTVTVLNDIDTVDDLTMEVLATLGLTAGEGSTDPRVAVIIPALNEEASIGEVIRSLPAKYELQVIVGDNGSIDGTASVARRAGAEVVFERERGYGAACLAAVEQIAPSVSVIAFIDADNSDDPTVLGELVDPILCGEYDMVIGSRTMGEAERGSLAPQQRFGNWLACFLMRLIYRVRYTDLGPYRAFDREAFEQMGMRDRNFGWTVESQIKAARMGLRFREVPVPYRCRRTGRSKVSGNLIGSLQAGYVIIATILRYGFTRIE